MPVSDSRNINPTAQMRCFENDQLRVEVFPGRDENHFGIIIVNRTKNLFCSRVNVALTTAFEIFQTTTGATEKN